MKTLIVVPARYGSTRFPGKPMADIAGRSMVERVAVRARAAAASLSDATYIVATDDQRIVDHCANRDLPVIMTASEINSGSDRALAAAKTTTTLPEIVVNLQGDAPFTPIDHVARIVKALQDDSNAAAATPVIRLDWDSLGQLRNAKQVTPFSGTTCIAGTDGYARWFSKNIIPAIRRENELRQAGPSSPVLQHIGLYAYRLEALQRYSSLAPSAYEELEGLEQLRLIENDMPIRCVEVIPGNVSTGGIDTPQDLERVNALIAANGDPDEEYFSQ